MKGGVSEPGLETANREVGHSPYQVIGATVPVVRGPADDLDNRAVLPKLSCFGSNSTEGADPPYRATIVGHSSPREASAPQHRVTHRLIRDEHVKC